MLNPQVRKGVVLAAGDGGRLGELTTTYSKVLLPVNGGPLISYPIKALVAAGITDIAVVVGHSAAQVRAGLGAGSRFGAHLEYIPNPDYLAGTAISVKQVRPWTQGEPFVLSMGDHVVDRSMVTCLLDQSPATETLCVDFAPGKHHEIEEATKVLLDSANCIERIGKRLNHWNAVDTGVFLLTESFLDAIDELMPTLGLDIEISDVVRLLISKGHRFATCDVTDHFWTDVDTREDLETARRGLLG